MISRWLVICKDEWQEKGFWNHFNKQHHHAVQPVVFNLEDAENELCDPQLYKGVDEAAMHFAGAWHRNPLAARALGYESCELGEFFEKDMAYYFLGILRRLSLFSFWIKEIRPDVLIVFSQEENKKASLAEQSGAEIPSLLKLLAAQHDLYALDIDLAASGQRGGQPALLKLFAQSAQKQARLLAQGLTSFVYNQICEAFIPLKNQTPILISSSLQHVRSLIGEMKKVPGCRMVYWREHFGPRLINFLWKNQMPFFTEKHFPRRAPKGLLQSFKISEIEEELKSFFVFNGICFWEVVEMRIWRILGEERLRIAKKVDATGALLSKIKPSVVIVEEDVCESNRILVAMAKVRNIYSIVIQHGIPVAPIGFVPLSASEMAVWGEYSKEKIVDWGVPQEKLALTGSPRYDEALLGLAERGSKPFSDIKRILGIPLDSDFILLATQPFHEASRPDFTKAFYSKKINSQIISAVLDVLENKPDLWLVIKLHPRDKNSRFTRELVLSRPTVKDRVVVLQNFDSHRLLKAALVLVSTWSTIFIEGMLAGKPVIVLDPLGQEMALKRFEWRCFVLAKTVEQLYSQLLEWLTQDRKCLRADGDEHQKIVQYLLCPNGGRASARIAERIRQVVGVAK
jgi:hypothetical protein